MWQEARRCAGSLHAAVRAVMVDAAERAILPRYRALKAADVREKAADELVTVADRESEAILSDGLSRILAEAAIVGEEAVDADRSLLDDLGNALCWIIDPLDGTGNYVSGDGPFGILVALAERGTPVGGWILDPLSGRFVAALKGEGTFLDGRRVHAQGSGSSIPIAAISPLLAKNRERETLLRAVQSDFELVEIPRCAAEQYPAMILGRSDVALFERTLPWDHAAGVLCLTESGGIASRLDGTPYRVDDGRVGLVAASTAEMWARVRAHVDSALVPAHGSRFA